MACITKNVPVSSGLEFPSHRRTDHHGVEPIGRIAARVMAYVGFRHRALKGSTPWWSAPQKEETAMEGQAETKGGTSPKVALQDHLAFSIAEFGSIHGVGKTLTYGEINSGRLKTMKVGDRRLISTEAAAAWRKLMEQNTSNEPEAA